MLLVFLIARANRPVCVSIINPKLFYASQRVCLSVNNYMMLYNCIKNNKNTYIPVQLFSIVIYLNVGGMEVRARLLKVDFKRTEPCTWVTNSYD